MLSRVADSVFWMSRYVERAENIARFIDVNEHLTLDLGETMGQQWAPLVQTTGDAKLFRSLYGEVAEPRRDDVLQFLTFDSRNINSILSCLLNARENARCVREIISAAMWEELNKFYLMVREAASDASVQQQPYEFFSRVKLASHTLLGITDVTMSHDEAWHFARLGRLLERADKTSRILDVKYFILLPKPEDVGSPLDIVQWSALLKSTSALEMYRRCHGRIAPERVLAFLVLSREFPRSMRFCLDKAESSLLEITGSASGTFRSSAEKELGRLRADLAYTHIDDIIQQGLHEFVDDFQARLNRVGDAVQESFFVSDRPARQHQFEEVLQ